jgi:hypothetical protein
MAWPSPPLAAKEACLLLETCVTEMGHDRNLLQRKEEPAAKLKHSRSVIRGFGFESQPTYGLTFVIRPLKSM